MKFSRTHKFFQEQTAISFAKELKDQLNIDATIKDNVVTYELSCAAMDEPEKTLSVNMFFDYMKYFEEDMRRYMKYLANDINYLFEMFHTHSKGHLPPITSAGKMQEALKTLGIENDFEVKKPVIYSTASVIELDLNK